MIEKYNLLVGDKIKIEARIKTLQLKLKNCTDGIKANTISDMPIVFGKTKNSKVEDIVLSREKLEEQILFLKISVSEIEEAIVNIDMKMWMLNEDERFIIKKYYIDNVRNYNRIKSCYEKHFETYIHEKTIERKFKSALKKFK